MIRVSKQVQIFILGLGLGILVYGLVEGLLSLVLLAAVGFVAYWVYGKRPVRPGQGGADHGQTDH